MSVHLGRFAASLCFALRAQQSIRLGGFAASPPLVWGLRPQTSAIGVIARFAGSNPSKIPQRLRSASALVFHDPTHVFPLPKFDLARRFGLGRYRTRAVQTVVGQISEFRLGGKRVGSWKTRARSAAPLGYSC